ncbi:MAG: hypothetical protein RLZZ28_483 [Bacteroidota bacterium]
MPQESLFFIQSLSPLYEDVQMSSVFADSKYFVDALPLASNASILQAYRAEKDKPGFSLSDFVQQYFQLPPQPDSHYQSANKPLKDHLNELWKVLGRDPDEKGGTLIPLPYPYIVPGGRFREVYYWDSYFTMLGLQVCGRIDIMENMINNFAHQIETIGFVPNGNRTYYLSRSQPPFFALMVSLLAEEKSDAVLIKYQPALEKEYGFWMNGEDFLSDTKKEYRRIVAMPNGTVLNRYWDDLAEPRPEAYLEDLHVAKQSGREMQTVYRHIRAAAESGWDFSSRWFSDAGSMKSIQTTDIIPVDLNCLISFMETLLIKIYDLQHDPVKKNALTEKRDARVEAINLYCWNREKEFYTDYHITEKKQWNTLSLAGVFPLFFGLCKQEEANQTAAMLKKDFLQPGGLLTTLKNTGQQWDAPNGWAPLQWMAYKGLKNYGHTALALQIRSNWMKQNEHVYQSTGKMMEKYNVTDTASNAGGGEYPNQDGFGWTNGVYLKMAHEQISGPHDDL